MINSIRAYIHLSKLASALEEARQNQYTDRIEAMVACIRKHRGTGKEHTVIKHQQELIYWVVGTKSAQALVKEGGKALLSLRV
ncbi:hypothetical protein ACFQ4C_05065 [Larkinella insperata]|uniref:Uncharacterized protein n=1 Tax=Larkinella insperata TaxID=332158 RepID=A0ABW3Q4D8_9BACT|nr:hypothetical protein [Larkinella insperata]